MQKPHPHAAGRGVVRPAGDCGSAQTANLAANGKRHCAGQAIEAAAGVKIASWRGRLSLWLDGRAFSKGVLRRSEYLFGQVRILDGPGEHQGADDSSEGRDRALASACCSAALEQVRETVQLGAHIRGHAT